MTDREKSTREYQEEVYKRQFGIEENDRQFDLHRLHSSYWMDTLPSSNVDLMSLASYRRAVGKFVKISTMSAGLTKPIEVKFNVKDASFTDSDKFVVLSSKINNKEFDAAVGLALHESNHIIETDIMIQRRLMCDPKLEEYNWLELPHSLKTEIIRLDADDMETRSLINTFRNWLEDRRIDYNGMQRSPGYRPYYKAVFDKYFGVKIVTKGIESNEFRTLEVDSYKFRLINSINPATERDALPNLGAIIDLMDVEHIYRLKNTADVVEVAIKVVTEIYKNLPDNSLSEQEQEQDQEQGDGDQGQGESQEQLPNDMVDMDPNSDQSGRNGTPQESDSEDSDEEGEGGNSESKENEEGEEEDENKGDGSSEGENTDKGNEESDGEGDDSNEDKDSKDQKEKTSGSDHGKGGKDTSQEFEASDAPKLSKNQQKQLLKELQNQQDFIEGNVDKGKISKKDAKLLEAIDKSGTTMEKVQGDAHKGMNVMVVRELNSEILASLPLGYCGYYGGYRHDDEPIQEYELAKEGVDNGIKLGKILARKLRVRDESRVYKSKRKQAGKIDKRLLHGIGYGSTSIFEISKVDDFGEAIVHLSVDASGSMDGSDWTEAMTFVTAIAYAASKVENLDVVISFRLTISINGTGAGSSTPLMVIAYDSRKDNFAKIKKLFVCMEPNGVTPEGLCFEAVMKDILASAKGKIGYFINFSDGCPNMSNPKNYHSPEDIARSACNHMRKNGIRILSFLIGGWSNRSFEYMYGKDARYIQSDQMTQLAKELNKMFSTQKR